MAELDSDPPENLKPLIGDASRQAGATIRGYLYQFWRTVGAWLEIGAEDLIFVEGAEDFDVVTVDGATTVQVKDNKRSGSLTLTTSAAQDAIGNYWAARLKNPGRRIQFKYVTTASVGTEAPGFEKNKGIEIWNLCRPVPADGCREDIERIRRFLLGKPLTADVLDFLRTASVELVKQYLIDPLEWICDQPPLTSLEEVVTGQLLDLGKARALTVGDAVSLAGKLCLEVARRAASKNSDPLDFVSLQKKLDEAVNVEVPRETLRRLEHGSELVSSLLSGIIDAGQTLPSIAAALDIFEPPVAALNLWPRQSFLTRVRECLDTGIVFLAGGAGIGKTSLVLQAIDKRERVLWADLRDCTTPTILQRCRVLRARMASIQHPCVVLDDLNPTDDPRTIEHEIGQLAVTIKKRGGVLAVTSYSQASPRLASVLGLAQDCNLAVPVFDENEVRDYLLDAGCPQSKLDSTGRVVWLHTSGHPQLVAARISALKATGFPKQTVDDFLELPKDIHDAQAEARAVVRALSEDARKLLYRLSIPIPALRRSHILAIAASENAIAMPGELFDSVVGPWFQQVAPSHYRISPLLSKCGNEVLSTGEVKQLNATIATALLAERTLTPYEFSGVLMHGLLGEAEGTLAIASSVFISAERPVKRMLAEHLTWVPDVGLEPGTRLPIATQTVRQFFRLLQWDIAGFSDHRKLPAIAKAMAQDFPSGGDELVAILPRILYLSKLLLQSNFAVPVADTVSYMLEVKQLSDLARGHSALFRAAKQGASISKKAPDLDLNKFPLVCIMPRVRTAADIAALVDALDALPEGERTWILDGFSTEDGELRILFSSGWLSVAGQMQRGWSEK
jgi:hypothetical protein